MIHFSCDRCQRLIEAEDEVRYVVRLEIETKIGDHVFADDEEECDHLLEIHEILERAAADNESEFDEEVFARKRFDLCADCYKAFLKNPMGQEIAKTVDFSQN